MSGDRLAPLLPMYDPQKELPNELRAYADAIDKDRGGRTGLTYILRDAAREIIRLRSALARLAPPAEDRKDSGAAE